MKNDGIASLRSGVIHNHLFDVWFAAVGDGLSGPLFLFCLQRS